jgi:hypothetical protein
MSDAEHHLYPLFPNSDRTSLPTEVLQGEAEPEVGQAGDPDGEGDAPSSEDSVHDSPADEETAQRMCALLAAEGSKQTNQTPIRNGNEAFFPIFNLEAHQSKQARRHSSAWRRNLSVRSDKNVYSAALQIVLQFCLPEVLRVSACSGPFWCTWCNN